jgi:hypothetical protein
VQVANFRTTVIPTAAAKKPVKTESKQKANDKGENAFDEYD